MNTRVHAFALGLLVGAAPLLVFSVTSAPGTDEHKTGADATSAGKRLEAIERALGLDPDGPKYAGRSMLKRLEALEFSVRGHLPGTGDPLNRQVGELHRDVEALKYNRTGLDRDLTRLNTKLDALDQAVRTRSTEPSAREMVRTVARLERQVERLEAEVRRLDARR